MSDDTYNDDNTPLDTDTPVDSGDMGGGAADEPMSDDASGMPVSPEEENGNDAPSEGGDETM